MTWIRVDANASRTGVAGDLAIELGIPPMKAFGHYVAALGGFAESRPDGYVSLASDLDLETWGHWDGRRGRFAAAFRKRCTADGSGKDQEGQIRGWWRQVALLRKQEVDRKRPPSHLRNSPANPDEFPPGNRNGGGDGTEDGTERTTPPTGLPGRLVARLTGNPSRYAVMALLENLPPHENHAAWSGCLLGCLDGMGLQSGRAATVDELGAACTDYLKTPPAGWGLMHFRSFVDRIVRKRDRKAAPSGSSHTERTLAAAAAFAAGKDPTP